MNPLTPAGNESQEAARARELADLVHKTKLGSHTDHAKELKIKTFDTTPAMPHAVQQVSASGQQILHPIQDAKVTLQEAALKDIPAEFAAQSPAKALQTSAPIEAPQEKGIERIAENTSLTNQSAVLHTLTQDVESLVKDRKVSMVRAVALESDADPKRVQFAAPTPQRSMRATLAILTGICLLFAAGILVALAYIRTLQPKTEDIEQRRARYDTALIFFEHTQPFDVTDLEQYELMGGLAHLRDTVPSSLGSFTSIDAYSTSYDATTDSRTSSVLPLLQLFTYGHFLAPDLLTRALDGEYMILVHQGEKPTPVFLFRAHEPDTALAGMIEWEKTLPTDLSPFFPLGALSLAETSPEFTDVSFNNIDTRALYDGNGTLVLMYTLLERNVIAITNSIPTMQEVAQRLHTQRLKQ